ncbi:recombinase family protein [Thiohalobacter thiocyanaticus]|nr:recombinase family protein [Thiohalobacter thiocyanaticus]
MNTQQRKAYSYLRFSTPDQLKGDSYRRQTDLSQKYARENGLELDDSLTFEDLGVSAYRGRNAREGSLGLFIGAVEEGQVLPGSYLLVESLDRLSRDTVMEAFKLFSQIIDLGITIVTLSDGRSYSKDSLNESFTDIIISLTMMARAHDESKTKSERLRAAWSHKRKTAGTKKLTALAPSWLQLNEARDGFDVLEDRAETVKMIFRMAGDGYGANSIVKYLNTHDVPTFGRSKEWHKSTINKILSSESVIGRYQPHSYTVDEATRKRTRTPTGDPIDNYYPAIIDEDEFLRVKAEISARTPKTGRKGRRFSNLFQGLARCGNCGASMGYVNKGPKPKGGTYLVCSRAQRGATDCEYAAVPYQRVEHAVLHTIHELDLDELLPSIESETASQKKALRMNLETHQARLEEVEGQIDNLLELAATTKSPSLATKLEGLEAEKGGLHQKILASLEDLEALSRAAREFEDQQREVQKAYQQWLEINEAGSDADAYALRLKVNRALKKLLETIHVSVIKQPDITKEEALAGISSGGPRPESLENSDLDTLATALSSPRTVLVLSFNHLDSPKVRTVSLLHSGRALVTTGEWKEAGGELGQFRMSEIDA